MSDREVTEAEILINEIRRLTIERDRYREALERARLLLSPLAYLSLSKGIEQVREADQELREAVTCPVWGCPRCGIPCKLTISMAEFSPDHQSWDCPECGKIGGRLTPAFLEQLQALSAFRRAVLARARGEETPP